MKTMFWLVWREHDSVKHKHYSEYSAKAEAERLARLHPDQEFVVLKSVFSSITTRPVETIYHEAVPF